MDDERRQPAWPADEPADRGQEREPSAPTLEPIVRDHPELEEERWGEVKPPGMDDARIETTPAPATGQGTPGTPDGSDATGE